MFRGADIDSDHMMLLGKVYIDVKRRFKIKDKKPVVTKINVKMENREQVIEYQKQLKSRLPKLDDVKEGVNTIYHSFQKEVVNTAKETISKSKSKGRNGHQIS